MRAMYIELLGEGPWSLTKKLLTQMLFGYVIQTPVLLSEFHLWSGYSTLNFLDYGLLLAW